MTSLSPLLLSLALLLVNQVYFSCAFQINPATSLISPTRKNFKNLPASESIHHYTTRLYSISNSGNNDDDDDSSSEEHQEADVNNNSSEEEEGDTTNNNIFAALPPIGASSFWDRKEDNDETPNNANLSSHNIAVSRKFHLSYTCKLCNTRNSHSITRLGYNHGVVIAVCKCCDTKHLIADNLGWSNYLVSGFDYDGGERNIEDHMKNRLVEESGGDYDGGSLRVDRSVFDLESLWHEEKDESSGALVVDEDGEDWS